MNLVRFNPFRELDEIFDRHGLVNSQWRPSEVAHDWVPLVDIRESDAGYRVDVELPAVDPKDVSVELKEGVLSIAGEREFEAVDEGHRLHRRERRYGRFTRSFRLPEDANADEIHAEATNGVISITVAKRDKPTGRVIDVDVH